MQTDVQRAMKDSNDTNIVLANYLWTFSSQ